MRGNVGIIAIVLILSAAAGTPAAAQEGAGKTAAWQATAGWAKLPAERPWGSVSTLDVDRAGNLWVFERCGGNSCADSKLPPVVEFDARGHFLRAFGADRFVFPHGIHVDRDGNVWVADADGKAGKGHTVVKFSAEGKVLLTLGKPGMAGNGPDTFNRPSAVVTAPNGDIYVSDGHGGDSNARIMKFAADGRFIKSWGRKGGAPGEFGELHGIALDSTGRVFVADRGNNRIQIFDGDGNFLAEWKQFGRPSGIYIDAGDILYVTDHASTAKNNPGMQRGIRIGSARDGVVTAYIPAVGSDPDQALMGEGIAADGKGVIYAAEVARRSVTRYSKP